MIKGNFPVRFSSEKEELEFLRKLYKSNVLELISKGPSILSPTPLSLSEEKKEKKEVKEIKKTKEKEKITEELSSCKEKLTELEVTIGNLKNELETKEGNLKIIQKDKENLEENIKQLNKNKQEIEEQIKNVNEEKKQLKNKLDTCEEELKKSKDENILLQNQFDQLQRTIEEQKTGKEKESLQKITNLQQKIEQLEEKNRELQDANKKLITNLNVSSTELEKFRDQNNELKENIKTIKKNKQEEEKKLQNIISGLNQKLEQLKNQNSELQTNVEELTQRIQKGQEKNERSNQEITNLRNIISEQNTELEKLKSQKDKLNSDAKELRERKQKLEKELNTCRREFSTLNKSLEKNKEQLQKELNECKKNLEKTNNDLQQKMEDYERIKIANKSLQEEIQGLKQKSEKCEQLEKENKKQLQLIEKELQQKNNELAEKMLEHGKLMSELKEEKSKVQQDQAKILKLESENESLKKEKEEIQKLKEEIQTKENKLSELKNELEIKNQEIEKLELNIKQIKEEKHERGEQEIMQEEKIKKLEQTNDELTQKITELENEKQQIKKDLDTYKGLYERQRQMTQNMKTLNETRKADRERFEKKYEICEKEKQEMISRFYEELQEIFDGLLEPLNKFVQLDFIDFKIDMYWARKNYGSKISYFSEYLYEKLEKVADWIIELNDLFAVRIEINEKEKELRMYINEDKMKNKIIKKLCLTLSVEFPSQVFNNSIRNLYVFMVRFYGKMINFIYENIYSYIEKIKSITIININELKKQLLETEEEQSYKILNEYEEEKKKEQDKLYSLIKKVKLYLVQNKEIEKGIEEAKKEEEEKLTINPRGYIKVDKEFSIGKKVYEGFLYSVLVELSMNVEDIQYKIRNNVCISLHDELSKLIEKGFVVIGEQYIKEDLEAKKAEFFLEYFEYVTNYKRYKLFAILDYILSINFERIETDDNDIYWVGDLGTIKRDNQEYIFGLFVRITRETENNIGIKITREGDGKEKYLYYEQLANQRILFSFISRPKNRMETIIKKLIDTF